MSTHHEHAARITGAPSYGEAPHQPPAPAGPNPPDAFGMPDTYRSAEVIDAYAIQAAAPPVNSHDGSTKRVAGRRRLESIPHLTVGPAVKRHDLGDSLARQHGVWVAPVACGEAGVNTTLTTHRLDRVRCPECLAAAGGDHG